MYDLILRGGTVVDGKRSQPYAADICIREGRIARIAPEGGEEAREVVDVSGLAVAPGFIDTDMTAVLPEAAREALLKSIPMGRLGQSEDVARAVAFFAAEEAGYITGQVLCVDGGMAV